MKRHALSLKIALALIAGTVCQAQAGDWNYGAGGLKGHSGQAIAVPAPAPVPEYAAEYYFRGDIGVGMGDRPSASETGMVYGRDSASGTFGFSQGALDSDFETFVTLGVGVGTYWSNTFRTDVTAETRTEGKVKYANTYTYGTTGGGLVNGTVNDETTLRGGVFLVNAYYDLTSLARYRMRPYVGVGVGFAWNEVKRNHGTTETSCTNAAACTLTQRDFVNIQDKTHSISLAAAATVGSTYKLTHNTSLDLNYRFLYIDGADVEIGVDGGQFGGTSKISIGESFEHQLRAGLRYDLN